MKAIRKRFFIEVVVGGAAGILAIVTTFSREWIEELTGFEPDQGNGSAEWLIVVGLLLVAVASSGLARIEWRRTIPRPGYTEPAQ
ncbi:MAG: ABC transporter permease [Micromonosporaceae bacterium]